MHCVYSHMSIITLTEFKSLNGPRNRLTHLVTLSHCALRGNWKRLVLRNLLSLLCCHSSGHLLLTGAVDALADKAWRLLLARVLWLHCLKFLEDFRGQKRGALPTTTIWHNPAVTGLGRAAHWTARVNRGISWRTDCDRQEGETLIGSQDTIMWFCIGWFGFVNPGAGSLQAMIECSQRRCIWLEVVYSPVFEAVAAGRTAVWAGSDWPGEHVEEAGMEAERSEGSALFPINDLARSRHCSASLNIRSTSTTIISVSSEAGQWRRRRRRRRSETLFLKKATPGWLID